MTSPWQQVGARVYRRRYRALDLNVAVILGDDGVALVDTRANHVEGDELRRELATLTSLPVRWVVNTHWHWDHCFGNALFPEAVVVGHRRCREVLAERGEETKRELASAEWIPEEKRPWFEEVEVVPPTVTCDDALTLWVGSEPVELRFFGRGHTDSDLVIDCGDCWLVGDLVEEGAAPSFGDSYPAAWVATLDALTPLIGGTVVPGHGDVVDAEGVRAQRHQIAQALELATAPHPVLDRGPYPAEVMRVLAARAAHERGETPG